MCVRVSGDVPSGLTPTGLQGQPAFTADGRHIVFGFNDGIAIMRTEGTGRRHLTQTPFPGVGYDDDSNVSQTASW